jgi:hypothetical protein
MRIITRKKSIKVTKGSKKKVVHSYWIDRKKHGLLNKGSNEKFYIFSRRNGMVSQCLSYFFKQKKVDYFIILILLLPVKLLLKIDKSEEVDPSLYVMY